MNVIKAESREGGSRELRFDRAGVRYEGDMFKLFADGREWNVSADAPIAFTLSFDTPEGMHEIQFRADDARDAFDLAEALTREGAEFYGSQYMIEARLVIGGN